MATMEVILKEKVQGLGAEADIVKVKAGYGRNFLIPQGKAFEATKSNRRYLEGLKKARAEREAGERAEAQTLADAITATAIKLSLELGQGGKAFGAITNQDIYAAFEKAGVVFDRHMIELEKPIKQGGTFEIPVKVHPDVVATANVVVTVIGGVSADEEAAAE